MDAAEDGGGGGNATTNSVQESIQIGLATFALPVFGFFNNDKIKAPALSRQPYTT